MNAPTSFLDGRVTLFAGDCLEVLAAMPDASIDAVVTDPPYGLEFMGKGWDGADGFRRSLNAADVGRESVFGRTSKRAPEYRTAGAGVTSKPGIGDRKTEWVSNHGWNEFRCETCGKLVGHGGSPCKCPEPKPVRADNRWPAFQEFMHAVAVRCLRVLKPGGHLAAFGGTRTYHRLACAIEDAGFEVRDQLAWAYGSGFPKSRNLDGDWQGWGTALKPAWEPVCLARKPLIGTVAENVLAHGTGALNIDACRVPTAAADREAMVGRSGKSTKGLYEGGIGLDSTWEPAAGRWPANIIHDGSDEVVGAFPDAGGGYGKRGAGGQRGIYSPIGGTMQEVGYGDSGSAARFFYSAKADADDRLGSKHPTVKPVDLMRWLVRLVTPPGGVVLDPFAGTGTTGEAAWREGLSAILIEREAEYRDDIARRMKLCLSGAGERKREAAKARAKADEPAGPLFGGKA